MEQLSEGAAIITDATMYLLVFILFAIIGYLDGRIIRLTRRVKRKKDNK